MRRTAHIRWHVQDFSCDGCVGDIFLHLHPIVALGQVDKVSFFVRIQLVVQVSHDTPVPRIQQLTVQHARGGARPLDTALHVLGADLAGKHAFNFVGKIKVQRASKDNVEARVSF